MNPRGLTRDALIETALAIVDSEGLKALSMRRLGKELGVDPMAAYRHLPNKGALLDGVVEAVVRQVDLDVDVSASWQVQVRQLVDANLRAWLAHPNVIPLMAQRPLTTPESLRLVERALEIMTVAGLELRDAVLAVNVMGLMTSSLAVTMTASQADPRGSAELQGIFGSLPAGEFPRIVEAIRTGQFIESYDQILDFWVEALIGRLDAGRSV